MAREIALRIEGTAFRRDLARSRLARRSGRAARQDVAQRKGMGLRAA